MWQTHLLSQAHVEIVLDTITASSDLVPDAFGVAFVECLNKVCTVYEVKVKKEVQ